VGYYYGNTVYIFLIYTFKIRSAGTVIIFQTIINVNIKEILQVTILFQNSPNSFIILIILKDMKSKLLSVKHTYAFLMQLQVYHCTEFSVFNIFKTWQQVTYNSGMLTMSARVPYVHTKFNQILQKWQIEQKNIMH
jgi:hypothetical protein